MILQQITSDQTKDLRCHFRYVTYIMSRKSQQ